MTKWKSYHIKKCLYLYRYRDNYSNATFTQNKSIQDHLALGRSHYAKEFEAFNAKRLAIQPEEPCFVIASRSEKAAEAIRSELVGKDVFVVIGAESIFEAYEKGRLHWKDRARVVYVHDDVFFRDLPRFIETVKSLGDGTHGVCGSGAPDALEKSCWWEHDPQGTVEQVMPDDGSMRVLEFGAGKVSSEVRWLDGLCLITVNQKWSWKVPGNPKLWHGYDWLASKRTVASGHKCFTMPQPDGPLLTHKGYGRVEGYDAALQKLRVLTRSAEERRDYPNIKDHLPKLEAAAKGVVLELGSRDGASTAALLAGVERQGGEVWSVDVDPACANAWEGHPQWNFIASDSVDPALFDKIPKTLDLLFIDSEHTYKQALFELRAWAPRVRPGGLILMHDTESFPDVKRAAIEYATQNLLSYEFETYCNGLGILRVPVKAWNISFVVLDATGSALTTRCLQSIRDHAEGAEIILVANGAAQQPDALRLADKVVELEMNIGFAAGVNRGAMEASRELLVVLNNDACFVDDTPLRLAASIDEKTPIVAPYSNRAKPPQGDIPREQTPKEDAFPEMVVGLCMMLPTALFRELGGFDTRLLTYEDDDFCLRAARIGKRCKIVGGTWVEHERHATFKALGLDVDAIQLQNGMRFRHKHPSIRVVAIAKNEASTIEGFYRQFERVTKDWCLLDTGSTDDTVSIAKSMGVKVETGPFEDFAQARNLALDTFGSADWTIMLDPDERLDAHTLDHLEETLSTTQYNVLLAPLEAVYTDGTRRPFVPKPFAIFSAVVRWKFKVHEKLIGSNSQALVLNALIEHHLPLHTPERRAQSEELYRKLMAEEPYFTDPAFKAKMRKEWPILDYDCVTDPRIPIVHMGPLISVVIPTYQREELLKKALASVAAQDYMNVEAVVIADGCAKPEDGPHVRCFTLPRNHGAGGAVPRNYGLMLAAGPLVAFLDDDNSWLPNHLSSLYSEMRRKKASFVMSSMSVDGKDVGFKEPKERGIDTSCVLHHKQLIRKHGWWRDRETAGYAHDWEFFSRWVKAGEPWGATGLPTVLYNADTCGQPEFIRSLVSPVV